MKLFILTLLLGHQCLGYVMIETSKTGGGKCVSSIYKLNEMGPGDEQNVPNMCMKATCTSAGHISYEGCSVVGLPKNCEFLEQNLNLPFPGCCKHDYVCK